MTVTMANTTPDRDISLSVATLGMDGVKSAEIATLGTGDLHAHNTFDSPEAVIPHRETRAHFDGEITLPRGTIAMVQMNIE